jgi:signal transduction histidine kinase
VYYTWSWLDFINVVFFVFGAYFFSVLARDKVTIWEKIIYVGLCVPAFLVTVLGKSVLGFVEPICNAINGDFDINYKLFAEIFACIMMFTSFGIKWLKSDKEKKLQLFAVLSSMLLFFGVFGGTEYYSGVTGIYTVNLFGLFTLPIFLIIMMFSITNLGVFDLRLLGTQILSYSLIIMSGSQLLFVQDSTHATLDVITVAISIFFGVLLLQNAQKEEEARLEIARLAGDLEKANKQQVVLIHFITHQIKGFLTKSRNIFSMAVEGEFGPLPEAFIPMAQEGLRSDTQAVTTVQEILNASNVKSGAVTYSMQPFDFGALVKEVYDGLKPAADAKKLELKLEEDGSPNTLTGDKLQLQNAIKNLIDNSIKYTPSGSVSLKLSKEGEKLRLTIQDTGVGITPEDMVHLFTEGGHGKDSIKVNVDSTGFGLYIVKNIIEAHHGKVWVESEGAGKGSTFIVELPLNLAETK